MDSNDQHPQRETGKDLDETTERQSGLRFTRSMGGLLKNPIGIPILGERSRFIRPSRRGQGDRPAQPQQPDGQQQQEHAGPPSGPGFPGRPALPEQQEARGHTHGGHRRHRPAPQGIAIQASRQPGDHHPQQPDGQLSQARRSRTSPSTILCRHRNPFLHPECPPGPPHSRSSRAYLRDRTHGGSSGQVEWTHRSEALPHPIPYPPRRSCQIARPRTRTKII